MGEGPENLVANDAGLRPVADEAKAALLQYANRRDETGERLRDHALNVRRGEGVPEQRARRFRGVAAALMLRDDAVPELDAAVLRFALDPGCPDERGTGRAIAQHYPEEPPPWVVSRISERAEHPLERRWIEQIRRPGCRDVGVQESAELFAVVFESSTRRRRCRWNELESFALDHLPYSSSSSKSMNVST